MYLAPCLADSLEQLTVPMSLLSDNPNCEQIGPVCHQLVCTHAVPPVLCPVLTRVMAPLAEVVGLKSLLVMLRKVGSVPWICKTSRLLTGSVMGNLMGSGNCPVESSTSWQGPSKTGSWFYQW